MQEAENKRSTAADQEEIKALTLTLKDISRQEKKAAAELRALQQTNHELQKQIQFLPENADDPKALRDRNHYLDSILQPLAAEHASLLNVEQLQSTAFTAVELDTNAYRAEADALRAKINEIKDQIAVGKEASSSRARISRKAHSLAVQRELRRLQEENNFLSTNLRLLRENLRGAGAGSGPRSKGARRKVNGKGKSKGKGKHSRAITAAKGHRQSNNAGQSSGAEDSDDDSYASDEFKDIDVHDSARQFAPLSPAAKMRAMSILGARLQSAENKKSPMRGGYGGGPRMRHGITKKGSKAARGPRTGGGGAARGQPPLTGGPGVNIEQSIEEQEQVLMRKRSSLLEVCMNEQAISVCVGLCEWWWWWCCCCCWYGCGGDDSAFVGGGGEYASVRKSTVRGAGWLRRLLGLNQSCLPPWC